MDASKVVSRECGWGTVAAQVWNAQQRAVGDEQHTSMINRLGSIDRDPSAERLTFANLRRLKVLSRKDKRRAI